jgi:hypothetical protein
MAKCQQCQQLRKGKPMGRTFYCIATCHDGTDLGVFLSGPEDEKLTLKQAIKFAHDSAPETAGVYVFDGTADDYWKECEPEDPPF